MADSAPAAPDTGEARLLIVWWSATGGSRQLAEAAAGGARAAGASCQVDIRPAPEAGPEAIVAAGGYLFVAPENLGSLAGIMKDFFDRTYYPVLDRIAGRPYAAIVCAGTDGQGAARQIARIATGWRLREVARPMIVLTGAQTAEAILAPKAIPAARLDQAAELGAALAEGLALGVW